MSLGVKRLGFVLASAGAVCAFCWLVFWVTQPETAGDGVFLCVVAAVAFLTVAMLLVAVADLVFWVIDGFQRR